jgi:hypothetical protein
VMGAVRLDARGRAGGAGGPRSARPRGRV